MSYDAAINKAWEELLKLNPAKNLSVKFLADEYSVDLENKKLFSLSCNTPAKDFTAILILHYLIQQIKGLPKPTGEWFPFREFANIEGYYPAFKQRAIEPIIRKYGACPQAIFSGIDKLPMKKADGADAAVIVEAFAAVPALIKVWAKDEDFSPDANIFFDKSITQVFCIEDIVVLAGIIAAQL